MSFIKTSSQDIGQLAQIGLFAGCTKRELRLIDQLSTRLTIQTGRVLCRAGQISRQCFVLLDGQADVTVNGHHETARRHTLIGARPPLTPTVHYTGTVRAITNITLLVFTPREFASLIQAVPMVASRIRVPATGVEAFESAPPTAGTFTCFPKTEPV